MTVRDFYDRHPYPPPKDDIAAYRRAWDDERRRADSYLFWPAKPFRDDRSILVAGCGTMQAAHYAVRWPCARVVGIDISESGIAFSEELKRKYGLDNLELRRLAVENARELRTSFDHVVCTGVLHHLPDPDAGLGALHDVLAPGGAMQLMVYAPYGRAGVYMLQDYCRRIGVGTTDGEIADLAASLKALPQDHPLVPLLQSAPDFASKAGLADALLHPIDRAYSVPKLLDFLARAGLTFGRWMRQAPYLPWCGAIASTPHATRLQRLPPAEQYAALELFRGTMVRHSLVAYRKDAPRDHSIEFNDDVWLSYVPIRLPDTIAVRENVPSGAAAVLINRGHSFTDLYLPIDTKQELLLSAVDGERTIGEICRSSEKRLARDFFQSLWQWDQVVFDCGNNLG